MFQGIRSAVFIACISSSLLALDFPSLLSEAKKPDTAITTVESLLRWIQQNDPQFLTRFTLMRRSESLQAASGQYPRAIVWGTDATTILAFNGHASQKGFHQTELIHFDGNDYEFRELDFSGAAPRVSPANPAKCMICHFTRLRPQWDPYQVWRGAFGKFNDSIRDFDNDRFAFTGGQSEAEQNESRQELAEWRTFSSHRADHPRYGMLRSHPGPHTSPFAPRTHGDVHPYERPPNEEFAFRPNLELTHRLSEHQAKKWAAWLSNSGACFDTRAARFFYEVLECGSHEHRRERLTSLLVEMGIAPEEFSLTPGATDILHFNGVNYIQDLVALQLAPEIQSRYPELTQLTQIAEAASRRVYHDPRDPDGETRSNALGQLCVKLANVSKKEKPAICPLPDPIEGVLPPTVRMCLSCHAQGGEAPRLPLETPEELTPVQRTRISERLSPAAGSQRMLPNRALTPHERAELNQYLNPRPR